MTRFTFPYCIGAGMFNLLLLTFQARFLAQNQ